MSSEFLVKLENVGQSYKLRRERRSFKKGLWQMLSGNPTIEEFWALKHINMEVRAGEKVGILGRNGAGKTTLLKIIAGILRPSEGKRILRGSLISLFQTGLGFHPELTARENLYMTAAVYGADATHVSDKLEQVLDFSELHDFIDVPLRQFSSGMRARLGFALAIHLPPADIYLVDESLSTGDQEFRERCEAAIHDKLSNGATWIIVTHNLQTLRKLCKRAYLLDKGRMISEGTTAEVLKAYLDPPDYRFVVNTEGEEHLISPRKEALTLLRGPTKGKVKTFLEHGFLQCRGWCYLGNRAPDFLLFFDGTTCIGKIKQNLPVPAIANELGLDPELKVGFQLPGLRPKTKLRCVAIASEEYVELEIVGVGTSTELQIDTSHSKAILFMHVPKSGGMSLLAGLTAALEEGMLLRLYRQRPGETIQDVRLKLCKSTKTVYGHMKFGTHLELALEPRYAVLLREPLRRAVSLYDYWRSRPGDNQHELVKDQSFEGFLGSGHPSVSNYLVRLLTGLSAKEEVTEEVLSTAIQNLERCFIFVATLETLGDQLNYLRRLLEVPPISLPRTNVTPGQRTVVSTEAKELFLKSNAMDLKLYQHVREVCVPKFSD